MDLIVVLGYRKAHFVI